MPPRFGQTQGLPGSASEANYTPPPVEMDKTIDLVDQRQIKLSEALKQLKLLKAADDIETPQLIVVGDQSSGKSSVLEALARFRFPVHERLYTRFPTKLILQRSERKLLEVGFELEPRPRTVEENDRPKCFIDEVKASSQSYWDNLGDLMVKAAEALGVCSQEPPTHQQDRKIAGTQSTKVFTKDVLVIEKHGPDLPTLSLVDLPDRSVVDEIFQEQIKKPTNLVLVVVTASIITVNQTVVEEVQMHAKKDHKFLNRVIAVITHPDLDADQLEETKRMLTEEPPLLGNMELVHKCHVVRNQKKKERLSSDPLNTHSLDARDRNEDFFFNGTDWQHVPDKQKGIHSLRAALKDHFWTRTKDELRKTIIPKVKRKIVDIDAYVKAAGGSRSNDHQRRNYLCDIAEEFERLIREGAKGEYDNERCRELHLIGEGESCRKCRGFFPDPKLGLNTDDSQQYKLCSNIRALNKVFAATMRRFVFPIGRIANQYYTFDNPKSISRKDYEEMVNQAMARNKGREPDGEPNWIAYRDLFRYQSARWAKIAEKHVQAVCEETGKYFALALKRACMDESVRRAIQDRIIRPNFEILQREANRTLTHLLEYHRTGNPGFFDSFDDIFTVQEQAKDLSQRLDLFSWGHLEQKLGKDLIGNIKRGLGVLVWSSIAPISAKGYLEKFVLKQSYDVLSKLFSQSDDTDQEGAATDKKANEPSLDYDHNCNAAGVIAGVESYYKTTMIAFIGYTNALVIEADILRELEGRIFSQRLIRNESQTLINEIAVEDEDEAAKRKESESELESLKSILKTLEESVAGKK
ncbi:P-loop containing nucleoside triphosphate hydrolase protein [Phaeosphaeriaceae sp. PMI808]|nr:P-loop containing nucleoside triphosphate hydrolase protein [Phaeosphaeriaceae sp. PMI808]